MNTPLPSRAAARGACKGAPINAMIVPVCRGLPAIFRSGHRTRPGGGFVGMSMLLLTLLTCTGAVASAAEEASLRVAGSDLLGTAWSEAFSAEAVTANLVLEFELKGSLPGREALFAGRADAALLAHAPELEGLDNAADEFAGYRRITIAWVAAVVVVPVANPLNQLTYEQLAGVFGSSAAQAARRWGDLGLTGEWATRPVSPLAIAPAAGLTYDFFVHTVLLERAMLPELLTLATVPEVLARVAQDPGAIALLPAVPATAKSVRPLLVTAVAGEIAFGPSTENIATGDYPLRLPIELVFRRGNETTVAPLLRFLASPAAVAALEQANLVPLPAVDRNRLAAEFRRP